MYESNESAGADGALAKRIDRLESNAAIVKLVADYCHAIDKHDLDLLSSVWHPDGILGMGEGLGAHNGIEEIQHFIRDLVWVDLLPESHHWTTNISLTFSDENHAESTSDVLAAATDPNGTRLSIAATYYDKFERRESVWRMLRRDSQIHYQLPLITEVQE